MTALACVYSQGPVVVHCSAGIGRTGCFIAVSIGTSQLMEEGGVDVLGIVCGMRRDRSVSHRTNRKTPGAATTATNMFKLVYTKIKTKRKAYLFSRFTLHLDD